MRGRRPDGRLDLLHAERDLIVVNKPAGLLAIPSAPGRGEHEDSVLGRARAYARHKRGRQAYAGMLHRLDRGTSGALAVALSREPRRRERLFLFVRSISKWAMSDVFAVGVYIAFLAANATDRMDAKLHGGFFWFVGYCVVSLLALQFARVDAAVNPPRAVAPSSPEP